MTCGYVVVEDRWLDEANRSKRPFGYVFDDIDEAYAACSRLAHERLKSVRLEFPGANPRMTESWGRFDIELPEIDNGTAGSHYELYVCALDDRQEDD